MMQRTHSGDGSIAVEVKGGSQALHSGGDTPDPPIPAPSTAPLPMILSFLLATMYVVTSIMYFLCIRHSKSYLTYDAAFLVLAIEFTKLSVSVALKYREDGDFLPYSVTFGPDRRELWKRSVSYAVPSLIYAVYNNLTFYNLKMVDAGTFQLFMQTRILFAGLLFTLLLKKMLTVRQWVGLGILTFGVAAKFFTPGELTVNYGVLIIFLQASLSSLAGAYNEYAFKKDANLSIHQQNFFMYFYAIVVNVFIGLLTDPSFYLSFQLSSLMHPIFIPIIFFGASTGLCAAFILKFINVVVKAIAAAVEVVLTTFAANVFLGESVAPRDLVAMAIVSYGVLVYNTKGRGDTSYVRCGVNGASPR